MEFIFNYRLDDGTLVTKRTGEQTSTGIYGVKNFVETYDMNDCNDCYDFNVFAIDNEDASHFIVCNIVRAGAISVDEWGHMDIIYNIVNSETNEVYASVQIEEH